MHTKFFTFFSGIFFSLFAVCFLSFVAVPALQTVVSLGQHTEMQAFADANGQPATPPAGASSSNQQADKTTKTDDGKSLKQKMSEVSSFLVSFFVPLIAILAKLIGILMGNDFIMGSNGAQAGENVTPIAQVLYEVWLVFRDIMNYIFIFILMAIGIMNIIPGQAGKFEIKKLLPKLVLAIVVINFTWFGAKVILDAGDIAAHAVFALPQSVMGTSLHLEGGTKNPDGSMSTDCKMTTKEGGTFPTPEKGSMCMPVFIKLTDPKDENGVKTESKLGETPERPAGRDNKDIVKGVNYGQITIWWANFDYKKFNSGTIAPLYAFSIMQVQNLPLIVEPLNGTKDVGWSKLVINALMALIVMVLVIIVFVVMLIVLFFRIVYLWINIIASPFLGLMMFSSEFKFLGSLKSGDKSVGLETFIAQAFAPAAIGLPLAVGFILISVGQKYKYEAALANPSTTEITLDLSERTLINGVADIHQLLFYILAIVVMWTSTKIGSSIAQGFAKKAVDTVTKKAEGFAEFLATAPMYIQFIPVKNQKAGTDNMTSLKTLIDLPERVLEGGRSKEHEEDISDLTNMDNRETTFNSTFQPNERDVINNNINFTDLSKINTKADLFAHLNDKLGVGTPARKAAEKDIGVMVDNAAFKEGKAEGAEDVKVVRERLVALATPATTAPATPPVATPAQVQPAQPVAPALQDTPRS